MERGSIDQALGPDLAALVDGFPRRLISARRITGLVARGLERQTFRLRFAGGASLKGRRLDRAEDAERIEVLTKRLDARWFAAPVARRGAALLEPWVEGVTLDRHVPDSGLLRECGRMLGSVHALEADLGASGARWLPERRLPNIQERLEHLAREGALARRTARRLADIARADLPERVSTGLIHRDLWPRNVVIDRAGELHVIDNGTVSLGAHEFDLARTEYLWPMARRERDAFRGGYVDAVGRFPEPSRFWEIDVLADVALFRLINGARGVSRPIGRLRSMAGST